MIQRNIRRITILLFTISIFTISKDTTAQSQRHYTTLIEGLIENIAQQSDEPLDYTTLMEEFQYLLQYPLDINTSEREDFAKLYILSEIQIENLMSYREKTGKLFSLYELQLIHGFSYELIQQLSPFVTTAKSKYSVVLEPEKRYARHLLLLRTQSILEQQEGFKDYHPKDFPNEEDYLSKKNSTFEGNPLKYYSRYAYSSANRRVTAGLTAEKDAGEAFLNKHQPTGFDFYSAHFQIKKNGFFKQFNAGDYQLKFGQGLTVWSGFAGRKSVLTVQNSKKSQGVSAYKSTDENRFFRGVAVVYNPFKNVEFSTFISHKKRDATILQPDSVKNLPKRVNSMLNLGLHRNENELSGKNALQETVWGSNFLLNHDRFQAGATYLAYRFSPTIIPSDKTYQHYNFSGNYNYNLSGYYQFHFKQLYFYGEAAVSKSGGTAIIQGLQTQAHSQLAFEMIYRRYAPDYHTYYANAFGEQTGQKNEEGLYMGIELHPIEKWKVSAYYDYYRFPWLRYRVDAPGYGHDTFTQIDFNPSDKINLYVRYKNETKPENSSLETGLAKVKKQQFRFHLNAVINENWEIRNRFELSDYNKEINTETGYLIYQDIIYNHVKTPLSVKFRFALFDTESYNSRVYAYENDILYAFSIPAYYLKGTRTYITLRYPVGNRADLYFKFAQTRFSDQEKIGSGSSEIDGNTRSEIKIQLRLKL